jgi:hypothetical protein
LLPHTSNAHHLRDILTAGIKIGDAEGKTRQAAVYGDAPAAQPGKARGGSGMRRMGPSYRLGKNAKLVALLENGAQIKA